MGFRGKNGKNAASTPKNLYFTFYFTYIPQPMGKKFKMWNREDKTKNKFIYSRDIQVK